MTVIDREWQDGDDSAMVDEAVAPLHDMLYRLYADFEYAVVQDSEFGEVSSDSLEALQAWAIDLRDEGVLYGDRWETAEHVIKQLGGGFEEEDYDD